MRKIPLTGGYFTLVDDADYPRLSQLKWYFHRGYARYSIDKHHKIYMHQLLVTPPPGFTTDHKNGDGLDNRRENLRLATTHQNQQNKRKSAFKNGKPTSSRYKGVSWRKRDGVWAAKIRDNGRSVWLGSFGSEKEAAAAYQNAALKLFGEFARI